MRDVRFGHFTHFAYGMAAEIEKGAVSPEHSMFACHFFCCAPLFQHVEKYEFPRNLFHNKGRSYFAITVVRHMLTEGLKMNEPLHDRTLSYVFIGLIPMLLGSIYCIANYIYTQI